MRFHLYMKNYFLQIFIFILCRIISSKMGVFTPYSAYPRFLIWSCTTHHSAHWRHLTARPTLELSIFSTKPVKPQQVSLSQLIFSQKPNCIREQKSLIKPPQLIRILGRESLKGSVKLPLELNNRWDHIFFHGS